MKTRMWWMVLLLLLPTTGCVGEAEDPDVPAAEPPSAEVPPGVPGAEGPGPEAARPDGQQTAAGEIDGVLRPVGGSSLQGQWKMTPVVNDTRVAVLLTSNDQTTHPGHIHSGTCDQIGEVVAPLQPVTTQLGPESSEWTTSTVNIPMFTMLRGDYVMVFRTASGVPAACGRIPYEARPDVD